MKKEREKHYINRAKYDRERKKAIIRVGYWPTLEYKKPLMLRFFASSLCRR
jgi:ribosomal protein S18